MRKSKKFTGVPVISLAEGQEIGSVKGLVVDPDQKKVAALIIEQKGWFKEQKFAPYGKVCSVGKDVITIDQSTHVEKGTTLPDILKLFKEKLTIIDCKVIAENGTNLGVVDEYYVEESTGAIVGLELSGSLLGSFIKGKVFLDISFVRTIGKEMVVTSNEAVDNLVKIDGGLQETMKTFKDSTSQFLGSTLQKTKEIGSKTKEELESKTKELGSLTKDLGESLNRQLDKVRGKDRTDPVEDPVTVQDLPPEAMRSENSELTRATPVEDKVEVVDLPPEAKLTREEEPIAESTGADATDIINDEAEVAPKDEALDAKAVDEQKKVD